MAENPNARLLALSDGVISIAMTLLVLDIRLPGGFDDFSDAQLWTALAALWPHLLAYLISFAVIAVFWLNHHAKFRQIVKADSGLLYINFIFLLTIGLVPFMTDLIAENAGFVGTAVYASVMVISGLSLAWLWGHAARNGLIDPTVSKDERRRQGISTLVTSGIFVVSLPFSFAHPDIAKYFWLLLIPLSVMRRRRAAGANDGATS